MTNHSAASFKALTDRQLGLAQSALERLYDLPEGAPAETVARTFDSIGAMIGEVFGLAELYAAVHPDEGVRGAAEDANQRIAAFTTALGLDRKAFLAFERLDMGDETDPDLLRFVEHALRDFRRSGVDRSDDERAEITKLQEDLIKVGQEFDRNIMTGGRTLRLESGHADLQGLPQDFLDGHPEADDGSVVLTTDATDFIPVLLYAERDDVRRDLFMQFHQRAYPENIDVLNELLAKRHELAQKLGYDHWAHWVCEDKMIKFGGRRAGVHRLHRWSAARPYGAKEARGAARGAHGRPTRRPSGSSPGRPAT